MVGDLRVIVSDQSFFFNNKSSGGGCEYKLLTFLRCFPSNMLEGGAEGSPETSVQWRKAKGGGTASFAGQRVIVSQIWWLSVFLLMIHSRLQGRGWRFD